MQYVFRCFVFFAIIGECWSCAPKISRAQAGLQEELRMVDSVLQAQFKLQNLPGLAVAITRDNEIIYKKGLGVTNVETGIPVQPHHNFHIASVSKTFTATAVMQLVEKEKIDLDQPLTRYLPYFSMKDERYKKITIKQMLNHTSGMPDVEDYEWEKNVTDEGAAERYTRSMADSMLISEPGKEYHYSNIAFDLLADVIGKVSGTSFETFVKENILLPLGMKNSSFYYPETEMSLRTTPHTGTPPRAGSVYPYNRMHAPSSTLNTSAEELAHWAIANLNEGVYKGYRVLTSAGIKQMMTPTFLINKERNTSMCLSWFSYPYRGSTNIEHGGGDLGYRSMLTIIPGKKLGIVILCNTEDVRIYDLRNKVRDILLDGLK